MRIAMIALAIWALFRKLVVWISARSCIDKFARARG